MKCISCEDEIDKDTDEWVSADIERHGSEYDDTVADIELCVDCWDRVIGRSGFSFDRELPALDPLDREPRHPPEIPDIAKEMGEGRHSYVDRDELIEIAVSEHGYDRDRVLKLIEKHRRRGDFYAPEEGMLATT